MFAKLTGLQNKDILFGFQRMACLKKREVGVNTILEVGDMCI